MDTPFTTAEFLDTFARYNAAVWPAQPLFHLLAAGVLWLAWRPRARSGAAVAGALAFFWAWMGAVYHAVFFRAINPAAVLFAALFLLQAVLLLNAGVLRSRLSFRARRGAAGTLGAILVAYALVGYPLLGMATGQAYPRAPTFGLPCPTTIFTFGVLLWADGPVPPRLLLIPVLWSAIGTFAAVQHGIAQDYALPLAAIAATAAIVAKHRRASAGHAATGASPGLIS